MLTFSISLAALAYWHSSNDEPGAPEQRYAALTAWVFYLLACIEAIVPVLRVYGRDFADYWTTPAIILMISLKVICWH